MNSRNPIVWVFDCFGVLVSRQPSSEHLFEYEWKKDINLMNFIIKKKGEGSKIGVLSNVAQYEFNQLFSLEEQSKLFDFMILSGNYNFSKPDARIYEVAIEASGTSADNIIFCDDNYYNIEAAKELGMKTILFKDFENFKNEVERTNA